MTGAEKIEIGIAAAQLVAAIGSIGAAWWIAFEQIRKIRHDKRDAQSNFVEAVVGLARQALWEGEKARTALKPYESLGVYSNFKERLADIYDALQPVRLAAPPNVKLILAVGRLSRTLTAEVPTTFSMQFPEPYRHAVDQYCGSIGQALDEIETEALRVRKTGKTGHVPLFNPFSRKGRKITL